MAAMRYEQRTPEWYYRTCSTKFIFDYSPVDPSLPSGVVEKGVKTIEQYVYLSSLVEHDYLDFTDWYVVRKTESGSDIPLEITALRSACREDISLLADVQSGTLSWADYVLQRSDLIPFDDPASIIVEV